jgi:prepilin-type N-terminal cleavage/methylation domain-containing protein
MFRARGRWVWPPAAEDDRSGFTLIELLVAVGIIAVLTGILLPALNRARAQANSLACQQNLHQIAEAIQLYVSNSKGVLPFGFWDGTFNPVSGYDAGYNVTTAADWSVLLQNTLLGPGGSGGGMKAKLRKIFFDPDAPLGDSVNLMSLSLVQYACHPRLMPMMGTEDKYCEQPGGPKVWLRPYKIAHIRRCSEIALVFDASVAITIGGGYSVVNEPVAMFLDDGRITSDTYLTDQYSMSTDGLNPGQPIDLTSAKGAPVNSDDPKNPQNIRFRHMGNTSCNVLMVDMHVETFTLGSGTTDLHRLNINVNP